MEIKSIDGLSKLVGKSEGKNKLEVGFDNMLLDSIKKLTPNKDVVDSSSIGNFLTDSIKSVSDAQFHADNMNRSLILGETDNLHEVMIAYEKADLTLNFAIEVKNKIVEAYKEIMRIQV